MNHNANTPAPEHSPEHSPECSTSPAQAPAPVPVQGTYPVPDQVPAADQVPGYVPVPERATDTRHTLTVNGLTVDASAIGAGLYDLIVEADEAHIVAFGMIPKWVVDIFERQLRIKIIDLFAAQTQIPADLVAEHIDEVLMKNTVQPITHAVCVAIYAAAAKAGAMRV